MAHVDLANIYLEQKEFTKADGVLQKALEVKPDAIEAPLLIGKLRRLEEDYDEAKTFLNRVLAQEPDHRDAKLLMGLVLLEEEELNQAAKYFDGIIRELENASKFASLAKNDEQTLLMALNGRGRVDLENKQLRLALSRFNKAREMDPDIAESYLNIGDARRQLGNFVGAETAYIKAVELDGKNPDYHLALGLLYQNNLNRKDEARDAYYKYFELGGLDYARVNRWLEELGAETVTPAEEILEEEGTADAEDNSETESVDS